MKKNLSVITLQKQSTLKDALTSLEKSGIRGVFVVDEIGMLLGMITDGDVRRALTKQKNTSLPVTAIMNAHPITAKVHTPFTRLLLLMRKKNILQIPLVDEKGRLVDVALLSELQHIPLASPDINQSDRNIIAEVLGTPFLSIGPKVEAFEQKIAAYVGTRYAIAVNSGTSGLHLCVRTLDIKDGDEVITTPFSFIASANCILFERAKPVFVDIDPETLCIDPRSIEKKITKRTKAILPVHIFGHPCDMDAIRTIAKKHALSIIEDACEALGSEYKGKRVGALGDVGVFAFYPNKQITTSEGGMIVTNSERIAKLCRSMRNQGRDEGDAWLSHSRLGYNYRMSELPAALGVSQMNRIDEMLGKRDRVAQLYQRKLKAIPHIRTPFVASDVKMSWFIYVIRLDPSMFSRPDRDALIKKLQAHGIQCRDYFPPIHLEPFYRDMFGYKKGDFPITENVAERTIALPFHNNLSAKEIAYISKTLAFLLKA